MNDKNEIGTITKNKREKIRAVIQEYKGNELIDLRVWVNGGNPEDPEPVPTKKGLTVKTGLIRELIELLKKAERQIIRNN